MYKKWILGIFPLLKNILSMENNDELKWVTWNIRGIYIGKLNEVLRFQHYAQNGLVRWSLCAGVTSALPAHAHFAWATRSTRQNTPSGHVGCTPSAYAKHSALVSPAHDQRNAQFCECAGALKSAQPVHCTPLCFQAHVQGQTGKVRCILIPNMIWH